jgi:hypothetical protein
MGLRPATLIEDRSSIVKRLEKALENIRRQILNSATLGRLVNLGLHGIQREYPNFLERFSERQKPREIHPAFYGCFDWHSAVHTHWMLIRLLKSIPNLPEEKAIRAAIEANLTATNLQSEIANFGQPDQLIPENPKLAYTRPGQPAFERPYGWAWLLQLAAELSDWDDPDGQKWAANLQPLTRKITGLYIHFLRENQPPNREGQHRNAAFSLSLAFDYAQKCGQSELEQLLVQYGRTFYANDTDYPAHAEPGPQDFCSPALTEAAFMTRALTARPFADWFKNFLPEIGVEETASLLQPVQVSDHNDPYISHLDGLNVSRAWCMYRVAATLPQESASRAALLRSAEEHGRDGVSAIFAGDFSSSGHWLSTFVVYLLGVIE